MGVTAIGVSKLAEPLWGVWDKCRGGWEGRMVHPEKLFRLKEKYFIRIRAIITLMKNVNNGVKESLDCMNLTTKYV